jgi:hypothetical protein
MKKVMFKLFLLTAFCGVFTAERAALAQRAISGPQPQDCCTTTDGGTCCGSVCSAGGTVCGARGL